MSVSTSSVAPPLQVFERQLDSPGRGTPLQVRLTVAEGSGVVPAIVFSHGFGMSSADYRPLADLWAAHGFAVIQPTHLDSLALHLPPDDPRTPLIWKHREDDLVRILDGLDELEAGSAPRLDRDRIAVAGHSWGAQSASVLLGVTHPDPADGSTVRRADSRVKAGILLALAGTGGANLTPLAAQHFSFMSPDFSAMSAPAFIVAGDVDQSALSIVGPEWWREGYDLSPGRKALFTAFGAQHSLGGIHAAGAADTADESPQRVAAIGRLGAAFLRSVFAPGDPEWEEAVRAVAAAAPPLGRIETK